VRELGIEVENIMKKACWKNSKTFYKHFQNKEKGNQSFMCLICTFAIILELKNI